MATDNPPSLAERIVTMFVKQVDEWLDERGPMVLAFASLLAVGIETVRNICDRPENEFLEDLAFNMLVMILFGLSLLISRMIRQFQGTGGFADTVPGGFVLLCMEAFLYFSLLVLYAYQALRLCDTLYRQWKEQR